MRHLTLMVVALLMLSGCRTTSQPVSEGSLDRELTDRPAPATPPPGATQEEPRPNYNQEPPKSQEP